VHPEVATASTKAAREQIDDLVDIGRTYLTTADPWRQRRHRYQPHVSGKSSGQQGL